MTKHMYYLMLNNKKNICSAMKICENVLLLMHCDMSDEDHLGVELVDQGLWTEGSSRNQNAALIHKGTVAPALQAKLGHFTEPGPLPRHVLNRECASCL